MIDSLGVEEVIARDQEAIPQEIDRRLEDGRVDVVADVVGGGLFQQFLEILRPGGRLVTAGAVAGPTVDIDLRTIYLNQIKVIGSTMGTQSEFEDLVRYIENGEIKPLLAESYPLSGIQKAQRHFLENDYLGSIVVTP
jgi:NADPH:quinone reductase-like Zn-dependent oxidoreductase